jgi:hypothetical protein
MMPHHHAGPFATAPTCVSSKASKNPAVAALVYDDGNATSDWPAAAWRWHARDVVLHSYSQEIGMGTGDLLAHMIQIDYSWEEEQAQQ